MKKIMLSALVGFYISSVSGQIPGDADMVRQLNEDEIERLEQHHEAVKGRANALNEGLAHLNTFMGVARSAQDLYDASQTLASNECTPDFSTSSEALMSADCKRGDPCWECFEKAINELNFIRRQLGRMNCIYQNTKNFTNSAIAFGDNASGIHAVTGLAWQSVRADILATYNKFKNTYDRKYEDFMRALDKALHEIDKCESKYGQSGWYRRSGFIYFEFMKEKYKRTD